MITLSRLFCAFTLSLCLANNYVCVAAYADSKKDSRLQDAVNLINSSPKKAELLLKGIDKPAAYAYLAFIYMTKKLPIANRAGVVDSLMKKAATSSGISDGFALEEVGEEKNFQYHDLAKLLLHLRLICDASPESAPAAPCFIFKDYPREAFAAFGPRWGSRRDSFFDTTCDDKRLHAKLPLLHKFNEQNQDILGDPNSNCTGTIVYSHYRRMILADMQVKLAPKIFLAGKFQEEEAGGCNPQMTPFLEHWSNQELWNKIKLQKWRDAFQAAETELANYYVNDFGLTAQDAKKCANVALWHMASVYLSIFSSSTLEEQIGTPIYKCFSREKLTLDQMKSAMAGIEMSAEDATHALSLAILNNAHIEVIDELIKSHAVPDSEPPINALAGGESPLFSAVLRPDVVERLLKAGAPLHHKNMVGKTVLIQAVQYNALDTVKALLAAGANVNEGMAAADSEDASKANDTCFYNYSVGSRTPLMYACAFAGAPMINHLLDAGANKFARDSKGADAASYLKDNKLVSGVERESILARLK